MYISQKHALWLVKQHDIKPDAFFEKFGDHMDYKIDDVLIWLGY